MEEEFIDNIYSTFHMYTSGHNHHSPKKYRNKYNKYSRVFYQFDFGKYASSKNIVLPKSHDQNPVRNRKILRQYYVKEKNKYTSKNFRSASVAKNMML